MDLLSCLDYLNSCFWNLNFVQIILMICGVIGSCSSTILAIIGAIIPMCIPYGGRFVAIIGAIFGACIICFTLPCSLLGGGTSAILSFIGLLAGIVPYLGRILAVIGSIFGGIAALPLNAIVGYILQYPVSSLTATCESLCHNLIWIGCSCIVVRAAYMEGCLTDFIDACMELIGHLM